MVHAVLDTAADRFGLGVVDAAVRVDGGLSNDMWRVDTSAGSFAIKVMRVNAESPGFRDNVEAAFAIEMNAFRRGVPCPEPCPTPDGSALLRVDGHWVRAHRWSDGRPPGPAGRHDEAGVLLARIHQAAVEHKEVIDDHPWDVEGWASLADEPGLPSALAARLREAAPDLAALEAATEAPSGLVTAHVASHGDLDPKNTLVVDDRLLAVDWDAASRQCVAREAVTLALDWSHDVRGFRRVIAAYCGASGAALPTDAWVFGGWVSALGGWLAYNATNRADSDLGQREVWTTCDRLLGLRGSLRTYQAALG